MLQNRRYPRSSSAQMVPEGWVGVRKELAAVDFSGWATAEVAGGDEARLRGIGGWMREVLRL